MDDTAHPTVITNPGAQRDVDPGPFGMPDRLPLQLHQHLPEYAPTPLLPAPGLAAALGVAAVLVKAETRRLQLPSYKILGASWAIYRELLDVFGLAAPGEPGFEALREALAPVGALTLVAATDGNHGRAVAHVAGWLGASARIYVPEGTAAARIDGIASEGADVVVVDGTYDEAVERSAADAGPSTLVISDTAWPGYERVPRRVVQGYSTIFWEIDDELDGTGLPEPTVVAVPIGVGSLAAAATLHHRTGPRVRPLLVGAEPTDAACVLASVQAGRLVEAPGPHRSIMAGLNCGWASPLAFPLLAAGMDAFVAVDDDTTREAMRMLAADGVESGESGAAGLAALMAAARAGRGGDVGLSSDAVVLLLSTEGATDPEAYREIVGAAAR